MRSRRKLSYAEARIVGTSQMLLSGDGRQLERFYVVHHNVARVQGGPRLINRRRGVCDFQIQLSGPTLDKYTGSLCKCALSPPEP